MLDGAASYDDGTDRRLRLSAAKYFASEAVGRIADRAGRSMADPATRAAFRSSASTATFACSESTRGTSQIQQLVIARELLR